MKIDSYAVTASSEREYVKVEASNALAIKTGGVPLPGVTFSSDTVSASSYTLDLSQHAKTAISNAQEVKTAIKNAQEEQSRSLEQLKSQILGQRNVSIAKDPTELKITLLEQLISALTGRSFTARFRGATQRNDGSTMGIQRLAPSGFIGMQSVARAQALTYESESVTYQAGGVVNTSGGRSIAVDINLSMSREFASYEMVETRVNQMDPLVINYGGTAASLSGEKFDFDLDMDGKADKISYLSEGSGFLALDKNGDGKINDGNELFGPQSGSGFNELRKYDSDGNGWIDENDDIWGELRIWCKDASGKDQLFSLLELDVGAIYLGEVETEFALNGSNNESHGTIQSTSFFMKESGGAGLVHHIDMTL